MPRVVKNPHSGETLLEEFLKLADLSQNALARALSVPPRRINEIVHGERAVSADTDVRLCRYFRLSDGFFQGLQVEYDLEQARRTSGRRIAREVPARKAA